MAVLLEFGGANNSTTGSLSDRDSECRLSASFEPRFDRAPQDEVLFLMRIPIQPSLILRCGAKRRLEWTANGG